jgi:hypothetical protein
MKSICTLFTRKKEGKIFHHLLYTAMWIQVGKCKVKKLCTQFMVHSETGKKIVQFALQP